MVGHVIRNTRTTNRVARTEQENELQIEANAHEEKFNVNSSSNPEVRIPMMETVFVGQDNRVIEAVQESKANAPMKIQPS